MSGKKDLTIEAQNYGLGHKLKSVMSPKGWQRAISELGSSTYKDRMETLRDADDSMRESANMFKGYYSKAEAAFKDNKYLDVAHWCAMINDGVKLMLRDAKPVVDLRDAEIAEYYTRHDDANPEHNYFSADDGGLIATAGILDRLFGNSIEKLYWKKVKESKLAVQSLLKQTDKLIAVTFNSLDRMGNSRAHGDISSWIEEVQRISKTQAQYQIFAKGIYDKHLKELADIVKANKPKATPQSEVTKTQAPPPTPITTQNPDEAAELVSHTPVEKPVEAPKSIQEEKKFAPGRPALTDPRVVEEKNKKELDQWEKVHDLMKGNKQPAEDAKKIDPLPELTKTPEVEKVPEVEKPKPAPISVSKAEPVKTEPVKNEPPVIESVKSEPIPENIPEQIITPISEVEAPVFTPSPVSAPKSIQSPVLTPTPTPTPTPAPAPVPTPNPILTSAPVVVPPPNPVLSPDAQMSGEPAPIKRGPGRPRKHPLPENTVQKTNPVNQIAPQVSDVKPEPLTSPELFNKPFTSTKVDAPKAVAPVIPKAEPRASKEEPVHVDIQGKDPERTPGPKPFEVSKFLNGDGKKVTLVLIPKTPPAGLNLAKFQILLERKFGHEVKFVNKYNGAGFAKDLKDGGYDVDVVLYDEKLLDEVAPPIKSKALELLDDPEFLSSLPTLGNGDFHKGMIFDEEAYPDFENLDAKTKKAVVDKFNKIDEERAEFRKNNPGQELYSKKKSEPKVENKSTETLTEPTVESPITQLPITAPKLETPVVKEPVKSEPAKVEPIKSEPVKTVESPKVIRKEELDKLVQDHSDLVERILGKSFKDITDSDVFQLLNNREYVDSLPRNADRTFNRDIIKTFPEVRVLKSSDFDSTPMYMSSLKGFETGKIPLPKPKAAVAESVENIMVKLAHKNFFAELNRVAQSENYGLMAAMMCKYSEHIEDIDPEMSIKLIQQAEKLLD